MRVHRDVAEFPPVTNDFEVTPEMIKAGVTEYALFSFEDRGEWVVAAVYRAMARAKVSQAPASCRPLVAGESSGEADQL